MYSATEENYLKAICSLCADTGATTLTELGKSLAVSTPTANSMVKKLHEQGLLHYEKYKPIKLTELGNKQAAYIIRRHRLTEMFLVTQMGFGWEEVHAIAEQLEHIHAPSLFDRMDKIMGYPTSDPHGSPIPTKDGLWPHTNYIPLSHCGVGAIVKLKASSNNSRAFLDFLNTRSIGLGLIITVLVVESFDGSMTVKFNDRQPEMLSQAVCQHLLVEA